MSKQNKHHRSEIDDIAALHQSKHFITRTLEGQPRSWSRWNVHHDGRETMTLKYTSLSPCSRLVCVILLFIANTRKCVFMSSVPKVKDDLERWKHGTRDTDALESFPHQRRWKRQVCHYNLVRIWALLITTVGCKWMFFKHLSNWGDQLCCNVTPRLFPLGKKHPLTLWLTLVSVNNMVTSLPHVFLVPISSFYHHKNTWWQQLFLHYSNIITTISWITITTVIRWAWHHLNMAPQFQGMRRPMEPLPLG